ncbi:hypothetical protein [Actinospica sp.]|jgi:hypothetical protein|uniref:hypothetical protein n=1 Tax=Actinospica sp. TaxID=1872142 RepID=UPI002C1AC8D0|nr:hypothetical protein [Actinospica sp.]HWG26175.1 hypothetical protein [Actinospica sp.]
MRRTSFAGALTAMAIGAVLAFAVQSSPRWLDLQAAGLIVMLGGAADLLVRSLISDSPLLSPQAADVAAVVEPLGDPVLDAVGNPVNVPRGDAVLDAGATATVILPAEDAERDPWSRSDIPPAHDRENYERALRAAEGEALDAPESPVAVTTITGRPVRPHGRAARKAAKWARRRAR